MHKMYASGPTYTTWVVVQKLIWIHYIFLNISLYTFKETMLAYILVTNVFGSFTLRPLQK